MRKMTKVTLLLVVTSAVAVTSSFGQVLTFDENGNSSGGPAGPLPFSVAPDPISGIPTLVYTLPVAVTPGDVLVSELATSQTNSDLLRFQGNHLWVFSDSEPGEHLDLADVPVIPPPSTNFPVAGTFPEIGPEGNNGIVYTPLAGQPGFLTGGQLTYHFISDVPEPASLALLGFGSLVVLMARRYIRRT